MTYVSFYHFIKKASVIHACVKNGSFFIKNNSVLLTRDMIACYYYC